ncbi:Gfo/Idh/MocA family oxidoreductase [Paenibacillus chondroitinus]|uniref:Gfo/Idh/MocA family oxidoreductase n=1 Tax=Paenibacillus chondroitinus TaxID=59842 RepID=A0ABU6DCR1_9BACL|nr:MULTISPECIES: Gfo/Idh/MocA family oxidoreductase [Paenibacillus]MCY9656447.1 Gfo/Idh/MocA family oxidoreductase [Paenibacillus anseongense]MEB4795271.1 Gfo/Idh/MocA family oxidoreductase [Paenibacillus chondroitinus]
MKSVRFGVVGSGYFGGELARTLNRLEGSSVVAVHGGSRAALLAEELHCEAMESLEDLVQRDDIDAIIVASPSHAHKEPVMLAAQHGKHVFCEKPIALTLSDCEEMVKACKSAGVVFMAGHIMHFMNGVNQVKAWIASGEIGRPLVCHAERTGWEDRQASVSWKKNNATSGGHLFHHIHELDFLQAIMGPAVSVCMAGGNLAHQGEGFGDEEDVLLLTLLFADGTLGTMQYGSGFRWGEHFVKINGTEGAILLDLKQSKVELYQNGRITSRHLNDSAEEDMERAQSYQNVDGAVAYGTAASRMPSWLAALIEKEMSAFRNAVNGIPVGENVQMLFDGTAATTSIATAEAAMASLREKKWISVS